MSFKENGTSPTSYLLLILLPTGRNEDLMDVVASYIWDSKTGITESLTPGSYTIPPVLLTYGLLWEEEINLSFFKILWVTYVSATVVKPNPNYYCPLNTQFTTSWSPYRHQV